MKKSFQIPLFGLMILLIITSCSKSDSPVTQSLKQSINQSSLALNTAVSSISTSQAFSILTLSDGTTKSAILPDSAYKVYIPLSLIKGVYNYSPGIRPDRRGGSILHFFTRTKDSSLMVVNMPLRRVKNPGMLRSWHMADSTQVNNFTIAVSDYHNNYNSYWDYDYLLSSTIKIDSVETGKLNIQSVVSPTKGINYFSQFAFNKSYTAEYSYVSGDTTVSSFTIKGDNKILYQEKRLNIKQDTARFGRESQYILTIGNVQIVRKSGTATVQVYVDGALQPNATVKIVDEDNDSEASVCKDRQIQITFEDGTVTTISDLIGKSVANIRTLFTSLHQVYFSAYVVDWIAYDIYYQR